MRIGSRLKSQAKFQTAANRESSEDSMRKALLLFAVPALLVALGFAQTPAAGTKTDPTSIKGCLGGADGNYTVAEDGTGHMFKITTSSVDLKAHLGHDVALTGNKAGDASSGTAGGNFAVTEVSMISEHCAAAAAAVAPVGTANMPPGTATPPTTATTVPEATVSTPSETVTTPDATVTAPPATASVPPDTTAVPAAATTAPTATVTTPSETVTTPPAVAVAPAPTMSMPSEPVATPAATAKTPVATVSAPAVVAAHPLKASAHTAKPAAKPAPAAAASAANAENAKEANAPTPVATPPAATRAPAQTASTPDAPIATPAAPAKSGFPTWLGISIVVVVLILGATIPLFSRWRKRQMAEQTDAQNLSFTHKTVPVETIPPQDKSGPPATRKAA
jgi:hypothetical protein